MPMHKPALILVAVLAACRPPAYPGPDDAILLGATFALDGSAHPVDFTVRAVGLPDRKFLGVTSLNERVPRTASFLVEWSVENEGTQQPLKAADLIGPLDFGGRRTIDLAFNLYDPSSIAVLEPWLLAEEREAGARVEASTRPLEGELWLEHSVAVEGRPGSLIILATHNTVGPSPPRQAGETIVVRVPRRTAAGGCMAHLPPPPTRVPGGAGGAPEPACEEPCACLADTSCSSLPEGGVNHCDSIPPNGTLGLSVIVRELRPDEALLDIRNACPERVTVLESSVRRSERLESSLVTVPGAASFVGERGRYIALVTAAHTEEESMEYPILLDSQGQRSTRAWLCPPTRAELATLRVAVLGRSELLGAFNVNSVETTQVGGIQIGFEVDCSGWVVVAVDRPPTAVRFSTERRNYLARVGSDYLVGGSALNTFIVARVPKDATRLLIEP